MCRRNRGPCGQYWGEKGWVADEKVHLFVFRTGIKEALFVGILQIFLART